jgi:inhibitor of KinA sporulation pathway (predicted exonuclease)
MKDLICVIDVECSCWQNHKAPGPNGQGWVEPQMEIIELGAMMVSGPPDFKKLGEFDAFAKPKINPVLSEFCKDLTSIRQADVDKAKSFPEVLADFEKWMLAFGSKHQILFASWGFFDKSQLIMDCLSHSVSYPFTDDHLNIKEAVAIKMGWGGKGVNKALERLGMKFEGTPHRGQDDVRNIVRIMRKAGI